ncbi:MAG: carboxypeptidase regulatory-like domain-containing protein [Planctomycetia bacterium]|nr:carboxypeptidase regulatory-like domain-containing protein [Planctomycetia bacterium]
MRPLASVLAAFAVVVAVGAAVVLLGTQGPVADEGPDPRDPSERSTTPPPVLGSSGETAVGPRAGGEGLGQVRSPQVRGRVLDAAGSPVPGAAVVLARASAADGEVLGRTSADNRGEFTFADVPTGESLVVSATAPGLDPALTTIDEVGRGGRPHVTLRFPLPSGVRGRVRVERPFTARVFLQQGPMVQDVATVSDTAPVFDRPGLRPGPGILLIAAEIPELAEVRFAAIRVVVPDDARVDVGDVTPDGGEVMTVVLLPERPAPPGTRADVMASFFLRETDPPESCLF